MPCIFLFLFPKLCPFAVIRQNIFALQSNWLLFKWQPKIAQQHQVYKKKEQRVPQTIFTSVLVGINRSKQKAKNKILLTLGVSETAFWSKEKVCGFFFFVKRDHQENYLNVLPLQLPVVLSWVFLLHTSICTPKIQLSSESPFDLGKGYQLPTPELQIGVFSSSPPTLPLLVRENLETVGEEGVCS